jgi:alkylhydroperoxidase/carboxymuconolactone decarboxylase family protein YurZ
MGDHSEGMRVRREVLLHVATYAGVSAANRAFAVAQRVLDELDGG